MKTIKRLLGVTFIGLLSIGMFSCEVEDVNDGVNNPPNENNIAITDTIVDAIYVKDLMPTNLVEYSMVSIEYAGGIPYIVDNWDIKLYKSGDRVYMSKTLTIEDTYMVNPPILEYNGYIYNIRVKIFRNNGIKYREEIRTSINGTNKTGIINIQYDIVNNITYFQNIRV